MKNFSRAPLLGEVLKLCIGGGWRKAQGGAFVSDNQLLEMECRLLFSKFKNETTVSLVQEKIMGISENHLVHRAGAFKLGLRTVLDLKEIGRAHV